MTALILSVFLDGDAGYTRCRGCSLFPFWRIFLAVTALPIGQDSCLADVDSLQKKVIRRKQAAAFFTFIFFFGRTDGFFHFVYVQKNKTTKEGPAIYNTRHYQNLQINLDQPTF